jgi:hypothetical protein
MPHAMRLPTIPAGTRIQVFTRDSDLRTWLLDELALMSPGSSVEVRALDSLEQSSATDLLIVDIDHLNEGDVEQLREAILKHTSIIAVGSPHRLPVPLDFTCLLESKLTSKQLKRAVRDVVTRGA